MNWREAAEYLIQLVNERPMGEVLDVAGLVEIARTNPRCHAAPASGRDGGGR